MAIHSDSHEGGRFTIGVLLWLLLALRIFHDLMDKKLLQKEMHQVLMKVNSISLSSDSSNQGLRNILEEFYNLSIRYCEMFPNDCGGAHSSSAIRTNVINLLNRKKKDNTMARAILSSQLGHYIEKLEGN